MSNVIIAPGAQAERLTLLAEECSEVIKAVCKIERHGWVARRSTPGGVHVYNNRGELENELGNLYSVVARMIRAGDVNSEAIARANDEHDEQLKQYTYYQPDSARTPDDSYVSMNDDVGGRFTDRYGRTVSRGDRVMNTLDGLFGSVVDITQDGDCEFTPLGGRSMRVNWAHLVKLP